MLFNSAGKFCSVMIICSEISIDVRNVCKADSPFVAFVVC